MSQLQGKTETVVWPAAMADVFQVVLGQRPKSDRLAPMVLHAIDGGRSYRWIARDLGISKNTVTDIVKRHRANP